MRDFCVEPQKTGTIVVNMLLNERTDGTRFWNLLKMMYVDVEGDGRQYIVAMQATVDAFMPKILQKKTDDEKTNQKIMGALTPFLTKLNSFRASLKAMSDSSFTALWALATEEMEKMAKQEKLMMKPTAAAAKAKAAAKNNATNNRKKAASGRDKADNIDNCAKMDAIMEEMQDSAGSGMDPAVSQLEECELECPYSKQDQKVGDHVCERLGDDAVEEFNAKDILTKTLSQCKDVFMKAFEVDIVELTEELMSNKTQDYCMAVSDPAAKDCPLVYVSPGFENLTGYKADFCNGRSCRFLQPTNKSLNDWINLSDRKEMRDFCVEPQKTGTIVVNMLLNERTDGTRFWNLLKMMYVDVEGDGRQYIVAMQATVDAFMPKVLQKKTDDEKTNQKIMDALTPFLTKLNGFRASLKAMSNSSFTALWALATEEMEKMAKQEQLILKPSAAAAKAKAAAKKKAANSKRKAASGKSSGPKAVPVLPPASAYARGMGTRNN